MDHGAVSQFQEDDPYKNQPLLIQLVRLFTCCNVSLPGMNYKLQESTPYFDASTHPLASLYPCAPKIAFCLFEEIKGPRYLHSAFKCEKRHLYQLSLHMPLRKLSCPTWVSCRNGRSAVPMVEWAQDDLPDGSVEGKRGVPLRTSKKRSDRTVCLEDFVKKNYCPHHFPFWCLASFFHSSKLSCRVCVILHCLL